MNKDDIHDLFAGKESEDNWQARDRCLHQLVGLMRTDPDTTYMNLIRPTLEPIVSQLLSARTQLSLSSALLIDSITKTCTIRTAEADDLLLPLLLKVASGTKKVVAQEATRLLKQLVKTSRQPLRLITLLSIEMVNNDKNQQCRVRGQEALLLLLLENYKQIITDQKALRTITTILRRTIGDASPECRYSAAQCFWLLERESVETAVGLYEELDGSARKQLGMALGKLERDHLAPVNLYFENTVVCNDAVLESVTETVKSTTSAVQPPADINNTEAITVEDTEEEDEEVIINIHPIEDEIKTTEAIVEPIEDSTAEDNESETLVPEQETNTLEPSESISLNVTEQSNIVITTDVPIVEDQCDETASDMDIDDTTPQPDDIIPHFISMDIDMNAFERASVGVSVSNDTEFPAQNDTENVFHLQNIQSPRMTLRQRLGLATSTPYKATSTYLYSNTIVLRLGSPKTPRSAWQLDTDSLLECLFERERCTISVMEKVSSLLGKPDCEWTNESVDRLLDGLYCCSQFSSVP